MCGISGIVNFKHPENKTSLLKKMNGKIRHRGPDSFGYYTNGPAGLAHARLSIIDLHTGDQPVYNEDKSLSIVFNGEIFNYPELREDLVKKGHRFYTQTDTEVLVHLYEEHGTDMFSFLNGQFAFALWDKHHKKLILGRDRVGIRPLFYFHKSGRLVFSSEIKAIFADTSIHREIDVHSLSDIFTCWAPVGNRTAFKDVYQIPPGHFAVFSENNFTINSYWNLPFGKSHKPERSLVSYTEELNALLEDAARIRLRSDVPVGAYLSGGIDSTYISSVIKKKFNNELNTFSVGFSDRAYDESSFQNIAVDSLKTRHHSIHCQDSDIGDLFAKVIWHTETPVLRTAPVPLFKLSELVRRTNFKVVLTGEGADEVFAGYNIFKENKVKRFWARQPDSRYRPLLLARLYPYIFAQGDGKSKKFLEAFFKKGMEQTDDPVYSHMLRWQNTSQLKTFLNSDISGSLETLDQFRDKISGSLPDGFNRYDSLSKAQYLESSIFLSNYLLSSQGDRMAMGNSIEGRYPFLDHRVIEFGASLPSQVKLNGLTEKFILKEAARGFIPDSLIDRPKQPYRAPIKNCFFSDNAPEYVNDLLSESAIRQSGYFDTKKVSRLISKCNKPGQIHVSERENMAIAGILSTQLVHHMFIENNNYIS